MSPASTIGVPSLTVREESASRVEIVGGTLGAGAVLMLLTSGCIFTVTKLSALMRGVISSFTPASMMTTEGTPCALMTWKGILSPIFILAVSPSRTARRGLASSLDLFCWISVLRVARIAGDVIDTCAQHGYAPPVKLSVKGVEVCHATPR